MTLKEWWEQNQDKEISLTEEGWIGLKDLEPEKPGRWKPCLRERYWCLNSAGDVWIENWDRACMDDRRCEIGNVFRTKEEAQAAVERMKIRAELLDYGGKEAREIVMPADRIYPYRYKIVLNNYHEVTYQSTCLPTAFEITFETEEEAHAAIHKVGADRIKKYLFGIEE